MARESLELKKQTCKRTPIPETPQNNVKAQHAHQVLEESHDYCAASEPLAVEKALKTAECLAS